MWCLRAGTSPTFGTARKSGRVSSEAFERELSESLAAAEQKAAPVAAESDLDTVGRFVSDRKRSHAGAKNRHHRRRSRLNSIQERLRPFPIIASHPVITGSLRSHPLCHRSTLLMPVRSGRVCRSLHYIRRRAYHGVSWKEGGVHRSRHLNELL